MVTEDFSSNLFKILRKMDAEACDPCEGIATGLNNYGAHYDPTKWRTEVSWSKRCAELWPAYGYGATAEVSYPVRPRTKCDDVVEMPNGQKLWLEIKGAWKDYWLTKNGMWFYRSYLFHPLLPDLDKSKTHTAALDIEKLRPLAPPHADYVGLLLLGFYTDDATMIDNAGVYEFGGTAPFALGKP